MTCDYICGMIRDNVNQDLDALDMGDNMGVTLKLSIITYDIIRKNAQNFDER